MDWLTHLDISDKDHDWYLQKHIRECHYRNLVANDHVNTNRDLLLKVADLLTFHHKIDISLIGAQITSQTLQHILPKPRSADVATDNIKDSDL